MGYTDGDEKQVIIIIKTRFMFVCAFVCLFVCPVCIKVIGE